MNPVEGQVLVPGPGRAGSVGINARFEGPRWEACMTNNQKPQEDRLSLL